MSWGYSRGASGLHDIGIIITPCVDPRPAGEEERIERHMNPQDSWRLRVASLNAVDDLHALALQSLIAMR